MVKVSASILAAPDQADLAKAALFAQDAGADMVHVDVMDGKFVEPTHYSPKSVKEIAGAVKIPVDVHLMVVEPIDLVEDYALAGSAMITVHAEAQPPDELVTVVRKIKALGCKAGIALNPETRIRQVDLGALALCDYALVMSVNPGWAGQQFIHRSLEKIAQFEQLCGRNGWKTQIGVDGGVNAENAQDCVHAGARVVVMGSAFYKATDPKAVLALIKPLGEE